MTTLTYNLSRQQAAERLGISTRTIDRYIKGGKLSYKKVANKVILAEEEIAHLEGEFSILRQQARNETIHERAIPIKKVKNATISSGDIHIKEFAQILMKKDKIIEEKNQLIFGLQHRIGELESKMQHMIALPDHTSEKQQLQQTIKELEIKKLSLIEQVRKEKMRNAIYTGIVFVAILMVIFFVFS